MFATWSPASSTTSQSSCTTWLKSSELRGDAVAVGVGFGEVISGVEKEHRNPRAPRGQHVDQSHALRLETRCDARFTRTGESFLDGALGGERLLFEHVRCLRPLRSFDRPRTGE